MSCDKVKGFSKKIKDVYENLTALLSAGESAREAIDRISKIDPLITSLTDSTFLLSLTVDERGHLIAKQDKSTFIKDIFIRDGRLKINY